MALKEKTEQNKFMKKVRSYGGVVFKTHGDELSAGQPDTIGALQGIVFGIEWKRSMDDKATPLQTSILEDWEDNGVNVSVQYDAELAWNWLNDLIHSKTLWIATDK